MRPVAVVTGATGQGGSYLCELLLEKDYHVKCLVRRSTYPIEISNLRPHLGEVSLYEGDVLDQSSIFKKKVSKELALYMNNTVNLYFFSSMIL